MEKELPFFARFLESQSAAPDLVPVQTDVRAGAKFVTLKYPSDKDELEQTLKAPSDKDEI